LQFITVHSFKIT